MENLPLVIDLVSWVAERPRPYVEVMNTWRTSCPRLTIWEDVVDAGLVTVGYDTESARFVSVTERGRQFLDGQGISNDDSSLPAETQSRTGNPE